MPQKILSENWSDYDNRKKKKEDALFFSCEEEWERTYLVTKIRKNYPQYSEQQINTAINTCCRVIDAPRPRDKFVSCVINRLRS